MQTWEQNAETVQVGDVVFLAGWDHVQLEGQGEVENDGLLVEVEHAHHKQFFQGTVLFFVAVPT